MSRTPRSNERIKAEIMLREYDKNMRLLHELEGEALHSTPSRPEIPISSQNRITDDTARRAGQLNDIERRRIEEEVLAVQYAYGMCKAVENGDKIERIIDLVYRKGTHTMYGAAVEIGAARADWAGRQAGRFFQWINTWFTF